MTDLFGKAGREWLAALELPVDESETVACCLREVDFLDAEVGLIESELAAQADPQRLHLPDCIAGEDAHRRIKVTAIRSFSRVPPTLDQGGGRGLLGHHSLSIPPGSRSRQPAALRCARECRR